MEKGILRVDGIDYEFEWKIGMCTVDGVYYFDDLRDLANEINRLNGKPIPKDVWLKVK